MDLLAEKRIFARQLVGPLGVLALLIFSVPAGAENADEEFKGKIAKSYEDSVEWWPEDPTPPEGSPNIIIFLLDDVGFAQVGSFGALINTPNIDRLAKSRGIPTAELRGELRATLPPVKGPHKQ